MAGRKTPTDARVALEKAFDSIVGLDAKFKRLIEQALTAEKQRQEWVTIICQCCGKKRRYQVTIPVKDFDARVRALDLFLTQAKGKPAETKKLDLSISAARTRAELQNATEEELLLLAGGAAIDE